MFWIQVLLVNLYSTQENGALQHYYSHNAISY